MAYKVKNSVPWVCFLQASRRLATIFKLCGLRPTTIGKNGVVSFPLVHRGVSLSLIKAINNIPTVLGKSTSTNMPTPGGGSALVTISYWRSIDHLHAFAASPVHKEGWEWFASITKKWPHIGIMHETFEAKQRGWENVYANAWPVGMVSPFCLLLSQSPRRRTGDEDSNVSNHFTCQRIYPCTPPIYPLSCTIPNNLPNPQPTQLIPFLPSGPNQTPRPRNPRLRPPLGPRPHGSQRRPVENNEKSYGHRRGSRRRIRTSVADSDLMMNILCSNIFSVFILYL